MHNELSQEEIDAMVRAARSGGRVEAGRAQEPHVEAWDVRRAGQIGRDQLLAITQLHEGLARSLTLALGSYLRVVFAATLVSAEHLTYREFTQRIPETTYIADCQLEPMGVRGALQLDLKVAFPIIDLLLGGEGKGIAATREITDIEDQIVESVVRIICRELGAAWQAIQLQVNFERRVDLGEAQRLMPASEKVLSLSFEIALMEMRGGLNLAMPVTLSHALLRKIAADSRSLRPHGPAEWRDRLRRRLLECSFPVELNATGLTASVGELTGITPGQLLPLRRGAAEPASLMVAGVEMYEATPMRVGNMRAAQLQAAVAREQSESPGSEESGKS
jgi:flagellar motor switch protein FliM